MKKVKYKGQNNYNDIFKILGLLFLIFIFFLAEKFLSYYNESQDVSVESLNTIKKVIEYYDSTYISEKELKNNEFDLDVDLKFKVLPYDENKKSNEEYYNTLIGECAKVIFYKNFELIDKDNKITIKVYCENGKIKTFLINDIEDYFIYMDSQYGLENYREISITEINVDSPVLQECINSRWNKDSINFGSRDSIFNKYYLYFDEGIDVRFINNKVYNIIFNQKYSESIVNGLLVGTDSEVVKDYLGKPAFESKDFKIIGYKTKDFYIFFTNNEISIYPIKEENTDDFFKLVDDYTNEKYTFLEFMNELTYIWPDYEKYEYDSNFVYISYPLKGVEIKVNYDDINGFLVYNNIRASLPKVGRYLSNTDFVSRLQIDLIFNKEVERLKEKDVINNECMEYKTSLEDDEIKLIGENDKYDVYPILDKSGYIFSMRFLSKNNEFPNRELNDGINYYMWYGNTFIYSKKQKGIYIYDIYSGNVRRIVDGKGDYVLKGIDNGILKYDDKEIQL